jgi:hypothetical protein
MFTYDVYLKSFQLFDILAYKSNLICSPSKLLSLFLLSLLTLRLKNFQDTEQLEVVCVSVMVVWVCV